MLIDWFTVVAQMVNFLVLVWLLKRFLYRPILNAIDARERRMAAELAEADAKKMAGDKERDEFQRKTHELEQQRTAILSKALEEAQAERQRLIAAAREDASRWRIKWEEAWNREYQVLSDTPHFYSVTFDRHSIGAIRVEEQRPLTSQRLEVFAQVV